MGCLERLWKICTLPLLDFPLSLSSNLAFVLQYQTGPPSAITRSARVLFEIALTSRREIYDEFDPKMAPVLLNYGKALFELAFSQQGVMGKEEVEKTAEGGTFHLSPFLLASLYADG